MQPKKEEESISNDISFAKEVLAVAATNAMHEITNRPARKDEEKLK
jgi:hypothetical protein